jgi:hypothetical protein
MRTVTWKRSVSVAVVIAVFVASAAAQAVPSGASPDSVRQAPEREAPDEVRSNSDEAMAKLAPELQEQVESGSTDRIPVFASPRRPGRGRLRSPTSTRC